MNSVPVEHLKELLRFFALTVTAMPSHLPNIPSDSSVKGYFDELEQNPLKLAVETLLMLTRCVRLSELGLLESSSLLEELKWTGSQVLLSDSDDKQWTLKACASKIPWLVFRRIARAMLEETGTDVVPPSSELNQLLVECH